MNPLFNQSAQRFLKLDTGFKICQLKMRNVESYQTKYKFEAVVAR